VCVQPDMAKRLDDWRLGADIPELDYPKPITLNGAIRDSSVGFFTRARSRASLRTSTSMVLRPSRRSSSRTRSSSRRTSDEATTPSSDEPRMRRPHPHPTRTEPLETSHATVERKLSATTEKNDGRRLAHLARSGWCQPVHVKSEESHKLRLLFGHRRALKRKLLDIERRRSFLWFMTIPSRVSRMSAFQIRDRSRDPSELLWSRFHLP
jgi:hypothetical protein